MKKQQQQQQKDYKTDWTAWAASFLLWARGDLIYTVHYIRGRQIQFLENPLPNFHDVKDLTTVNQVSDIFTSIPHPCTLKAWIH